MPAKNPRINVVLEKPVYDAIRKIAKKEGISISLKARDLLREALEIYEDNILESIASEREATFNRRNTLTGEDVWMDRPASSQED
jgi:histone H3/H4